MGSCGCNDFKPDFRMAGPDEKIYAVQVYRGCSYCDAPAGLVVWLMTSEEADEWGGLNDLPELLPDSDLGASVKLIEPDRVARAVCLNVDDPAGSDVSELYDSGQWINAIQESINVNIFNPKPFKIEIDRETT